MLSLTDNHVKLTTSYPPATASRKASPKCNYAFTQFLGLFLLETRPTSLSANAEWLAERLTKETLNCRTIQPGSTKIAICFSYSHLWSDPACVWGFMHSLASQEWRQHSDCTRRPLTKSANKLIEYWMQYEVSLWRNANQLQGISSQTCSALTYRAGEEQSVNVRKKNIMGSHSFQYMMETVIAAAIQWGPELKFWGNYKSWQQMTRCRRFAAPLFQFKFSERLHGAECGSHLKNLIALISEELSA